jgi:hypothetical protein
VTAILNTSGAERRSLWVSVDEPFKVLGNSLRPRAKGNFSATWINFNAERNRDVAQPWRKWFNTKRGESIPSSLGHGPRRAFVCAHSALRVMAGGTARKAVGGVAKSDWGEVEKVWSWDRRPSENASPTCD